MFGLAMLAVTALAPLGPSPSAPAARLEFKGAALGMTLSDWRTSPFPGAASVKPVCSGDPGAAAAGIKLTADERSEGALVCTYAYVGTDGPRADVPIGGGLVARRVRYVFRHGQLAAISYRASADAFDAIVARVDAQIGHASTVTRDQARLTDGVVLQRVHMRWSGRAGAVTLTDPEADGRLSVVLAAS